MKQSLLKKASYIAACTMLAGAVGATAAYAVNENTADTQDTEAPAKTEEADVTDEYESKDETVYVLAGANGSTNKIIVSDHIKNLTGKSTLTEKTNMHGVENVKGDETYTEDGDERTWNADGSDIYYQGTYSGDLPIDMKITYKLDGEEISPEALLGKSGKVTIRFDYTNNIYEETEIGGKKEKIYVPFAAITGLMLDNDSFKNVEVKNAKTVSDGDRTFVIGTAFPGLEESLGLTDNDKIDIPDYVEITADATDFTMTNTVTAVSNELLNEINIDTDDKTKTVTEDIDKLSDAMNKLIDGTDTLYDGMSQLLEKSGDLAEGVGSLYDGAGKLSDGAAKANSGAAQLYTGSGKLSAGLDELSSNSAELTAGSEQVFDSLLDMANTQLEASGITGYKLTIDNYSETLDKIIASLDGDSVLKQAKDKAMQQVTEAVEAKRPVVEAEVTKAVKAQVEEKVNAGVKATVTEKVTAAVRDKVFEAVLATQGLTKEKYEQAKAAGLIDEAKQAAIEGAVDQQMQTDDVKAQIEAVTEQQMKSPEVKAQAQAALDQQMQSDEVKKIIKDTTDAKIKELIEQNFNSDDVQSKIKEALGTAKAGVAKLHDLKTQLDSYNTFYTGLAKYTDGVDSAAQGAKQIKDGLGDLSNGTAALETGASQLYDGISTLNDSMPALTEGITKLTDGSKQLSDGCKQFNEEGISKIISLVDGDLGNIIDRFNALKKVSSGYETYTGGSGSVKFVYRTDAVEK